MVDCLQHTTEELTNEDVMIILTALSFASYGSRALKKTIWPKIKSSELFQNRNASDIDWLNITLNLIALNHFDQELLIKVLSHNYLQSVFDNQQLSNDFTQQYSSLLKIYQSLELLPEMTDFVNIESIGLSGTMSYIQKAIELNLSNTLKCPLQTYLRNEFGSDKVLTMIKTKYGHGIQHILKVDKDNGEFVSFEESESKRGADGFIELTEIKCSENEML